MDYVALALLILITTLLMMLILRLSRAPQDDPANQRLKQEIDALRQELMLRLDGSSAAIDNHLQRVNKSMDNMLPKLGGLDEANKQLLRVSKEIEQFQRNLLHPKIRGGVGEVILAHILSQMLPEKQYELQFTFQGGKRTDAVIKLASNTMIAVDAKFPLQGYLKLGEADEKTEGTKRKQFIRDIKNHIDKISKQYILPEEGTLDFALMYIPVEAVYYETITMNSDEERSLHEYAHLKRVIPVSPNTFYAYLQTILLGLNAMRIEESAQVILKDLQGIRNDFTKLDDALSLTFGHMGKMNSAFTNTRTLSDKLKTKLDNI